MQHGTGDVPGQARMQHGTGDVAAARRTRSCPGASSRCAPHADRQMCAVGVPVVRGAPASPLPTGTELFHIVMSLVMQDDYHGIVELARRGGTSVDFKRKCGFTVALRLEASALDAKDFPRHLRVDSANLLHYAICISCFRAAVALLVACPSLLQGKCAVYLGEDEQLERSGTWNQKRPASALVRALFPGGTAKASELARLFRELYRDADGEVSPTARMYNSALATLTLGERDCTKLPFLGLDTIPRRCAAAGCNSEAALAAFLAAVAHDDSVGAMEMCNNVRRPVS